MSTTESLGRAAGLLMDIWSDPEGRTPMASWIGPAGCAGRSDGSAVSWSVSLRALRGPDRAAGPECLAGQAVNSGPCRGEPVWV